MAGFVGIRTRLADTFFSSRACDCPPVMSEGIIVRPINALRRRAGKQRAPADQLISAKSANRDGGVQVSEKSAKRSHAVRRFPRALSGNPTGRPSRLTKVGETFLKEMFKPVEAKSTARSCACRSASRPSERGSPSRAWGS
jgi:hypothetical protein